MIAGGNLDRVVARRGAGQFADLRLALAEVGPVGIVTGVAELGRFDDDADHPHERHMAERGLCGVGHNRRPTQEP
jgi:hypothetical protein